MRVFQIQLSNYREAINHLSPKSAIELVVNLCENYVEVGINSYYTIFRRLCKNV